METISLKLTKTVRYNDLRPYGRFTVKSKTRQGHLPRIIPFIELQYDSSETMPTTDEDDKELIKFMKKHKTDILTDGYRFYTLCGSGLSEVYHKKLGLYRNDLTFKELVDEL